MDFCGATLPFAGGGYLRLYPQWLIDYGFDQNHAAGRPCITYIHPREVNPNHPRVPKPLLTHLKARLKYHKYYVNLRTTQRTLEHLLRRYRFGTVTRITSCLTDLPAFAGTGDTPQSHRSTTSGLC